MVKEMQETDKKTIGHLKGLRIEISWNNALCRSDTVSKATCGHLSLWIGEILIWGGENDTGAVVPVKWTWTELLEFLSSSWNYIVYEETYPADLKPHYPGELREKANQRWENMPEAISIKEEKEIYLFEGSHDFSRGLNGIQLPTVFLMREGNCIWIGTPGYYIRRPLNETVKILVEIGNFICDRIIQLEEPRAKYICSCWKERDNLAKEGLLSIITNLSVEDIRDIQGNKSFESVWETNPDHIKNFEITELQAAARMISGKTGKQNIRFVLDEIRKIGHSDIPVLDCLAQQAISFINEFKERRFYEQGYMLANWLRRQAGVISSGGKVKPVKLLTDWGVSIKEIEFDETRIDAIACWGPRHGPAILLNSKGVHNQRPSGRCSTYAHEICHLLVDRQGFLPLVEIFGGNLPWGAERRANAFAAELLLPRTVVAEYIKVNPNYHIERICRHLSSKYKVGFHLIANQILNSLVSLNFEQRNYLEKFRML